MNEEPQGTGESRGAIDLHKKYVAGVKLAMRNLFKGQALSPSSVAMLLGMKRLHLPAPPMLETALSYRGTLRFVAFHYSPRLAVPVHSDGGDDLPIPNQSDWLNFISHPAVCPELDQYSTLFGRLGINRMLTSEEFEDLDDTERGAYCNRFHALVLDREERMLYVSGWKPLKMFQPYSEPDDDEAHCEVVDGRLVSRGDEDYTQPALPESVEALIGWLNDQLKYAEVQERWAHWHIHHGRPEEGFQILRSVIKDYPERKESPEFQQTLSYLFRELHDYGAAISAFEEYARASSMDAYDHLVLGRLYLEAKRYREALNQLRQGKEKEPEPRDSEWYAFEARAYTGLGDFDRALQACDAGMKELYSDDGLQLDAGPIHLELADIAALNGDFVKAALECRAALQEGYEDETEIEDSIVIYRPGWWLSTEARLSNAARYFDAAAETSFNVHLGRGYLYLGMSRYADAEEQFQQASINNSPEAFWFWGVSALASKRRDRAIQIFDDMIQRFAQDERGLVGLALVHAAQAANDIAFEYCNKAIDINPHGGELHVVLTYLYWSQGNYSEAASEARKASRAGFSIHQLLVSAPDDHAKDHRFLTLGGDGSGLQALAVK